MFLIEFDDTSVDIDNLNTHSEIIKFLDDIKGIDVINIDASKVKKLDRELYAEFDFLLEKEKAIISFLLACIEKKGVMEEKLFPPAQELLNQITKILQIETTTPVPEVNQDLWSEYNKLSHVYKVAKSYLDYNLLCRLGFEMYIGYEPDGKILALKDLRNLSQQTLAD